MHIPVLIGAFFLSPPVAAMVGALSPLIGSFVMGMPVLYPIAIIMVFELMVYGFVASTLSKRMDVYYSLIFAMIAGRLMAGVVVFVLQSFLGLNMNYLIYLKGAVITGLPGIALQLLLIPALVKILKKSLRR
jgi:hypothetical protein